MKVPGAFTLLIGAALLACLNVTPIRAATTVLHNFVGSATDGAYPEGSLTLSGSKLYGMTVDGGGSSSGAIFSMNTDGTGFGLLHSFTGTTSDGDSPDGSLTLSGAKLFGMTRFGGSGGNGAIFSLNTDGSGFGLLHSFTGPTSDGSFPLGSLTVSGSKLYGMTSSGGSIDGGVLFSMTTDGTAYTLLHNFTVNASDGVSPYGSLTLSGSKLYGMTSSGGSGNGGVLFRINTDGTGFGLLHTFTGVASDGANPYGSLMLSGSRLYGMTLKGGSSNTGTLFSMNIDGSGFSLLHSFNGSVSDGGYPVSSLTLSGSTLYGMTHRGGSSDLGVLFSVGTDGSGFDVLESFGGLSNAGAAPAYGDLSLSADSSTLYGMTSYGGNANRGVIFSRAIPEPGASLLFGLGMLLLAACRPRARMV